MYKRISRLQKCVYTLIFSTVSILCFLIYIMEESEMYLAPESKPVRRSNVTIFHPNSQANTSDYVNVSETGSLLYVGTALWTGDGVRIAGIKRSQPEALRWNTEYIPCFLWFSSDLDSIPAVVGGWVTHMQSYTEPNANAYIKCPILPDTQKKTTPLYVGLGYENTTYYECTIIISVENREVNPHRIFKNRTSRWSEKRSTEFGIQPDKYRVVEFTVCIPPMFNYNKAAQLVEKVEMVRLLGARRVVLYKLHVESNVEAVLNFYTGEWEAGNETLEVVVRPWKLPPIAMHYNGQTAAIDDCLYRYGWLSQYIVFNDLDEFMIPLRHDNWSSLIAEREKLNSSHAAFMFRSSVMNKDHSIPAKRFRGDAFRYGSSILGFTRRDNYIYEPKDKGKLIVNPRKVETLEVHHTYEAKGTTDVIPLDQGLLYHYRWPLETCRVEVKDIKVVSKFGKQLLIRLKYVWSRLIGVSLGETFPIPGRARAKCKASRPKKMHVRVVKN